jgi:ectoine hydroxylase-related dioxygenase (phytanoyl-CoA dioxygenase family)
MTATIAEPKTKSAFDLAAAKEKFDRDGYCVIEGALDVTEAERLDAAGRPFFKKTGYTKFEDALNNIPGLAPLCTHPAVMAIAEHVWGKEFYIANGVCFMWCQPGAPLGQLHADWPAHRIPRPIPRWPMLLQTMWMLTDFTAENGATRVVPGSHLSGRGAHEGPSMGDSIPVVGKRGSVLIWHNALWHQNGSNTTKDQHRMGANIAYLPWVVNRPVNEWPLVRRELYETFSPQLQKLLERSVEPAKRS